MSFKTNVLTVRSLVERMIQDADNERRRLQSKLDANISSEYTASRSAEETEQDRAILVVDLARAESDVAAAPEGSRKKAVLELQRDTLSIKLRRMDLADSSEDSNQKEIVDGATSIKRIQALLDVQVALIAELNERLAQLPAV